MTTTPTLPDRIKAERKRRRWRQCDVAELFGVSQTVISLWERGRIWPAVDKLDKLATFLRIDPTEVGELWKADHVAHTQRRLDASIAAKKPSDPIDELRAELDRLRAETAETRRQLAELRRIG